MSDTANEVKLKHWRDGRAAYQAGEKHQTNPHEPDTLANVFWHHGWRSVRGRGRHLWARAETLLAK